LTWNTFSATRFSSPCLNHLTSHPPIPTFDVKQWPVITRAARQALDEIVDTHYIVAPPVYDHPGQLIRPRDYARRFRGSIAIVKFHLTRYKLPKQNVVCLDLAHLRVLVTPSPLTPVTPRFKRTMVLDLDLKFSITQPDFKKAKLETHTEGIHSPSSILEELN
jgi:hypothetical protein